MLEEETRRAREHEMYLKELEEREIKRRHDDAAHSLMRQSQPVISEPLMRRSSSPMRSTVQQHVMRVPEDVVPVVEPR